MSSPYHRVTLKDIAREAELSVAAVSMALKNHPSLPATTIARVKGLAERMGYAPDPALSALAAHRSRLRVQNHFSVIGLITNWGTADAWSHLPSSQEVIKGAETRALQLGYSLQTLWARVDGASPARFSQILRARGIRGLVLAPFEQNDARLDLDWKRFSVVTIARPSRYTHFHHVVQNHYMDLLLCWKKLAERGYRRVGLVVEREFAHRWSHQWEAAHSYALSQRVKAEDAVPTLVVEPSTELASIRDWLRRYRPQAVISRCDQFLQAAAKEKLRVPEDIGYLSLNVNDDIATATGIRHHRDIMGAMAIDVLNSQMHRNQTGPQEVSLGTQVDGTWQEGETLPAIRNA